MDFFTNLLGLGLFIVCLVIVGIFLADFVRFGTGSGKGSHKNGRTAKTVWQPQMQIAYTVSYRNRVVGEGMIDMKELPVQFGRRRDSGNDIAVSDYGLPQEALTAVSQAWFFIQADASGRPVLYSAEPGRKPSKDKKLVVVENGKARLERAVRLDNELTLRAERLTLTFNCRV